MFKLIDLIRLTGLEINPDDCKIHFATGIEPPLEAFYSGTFKEWQEYQHNRNFECRFILSLIHLYGGDWLFAGIYQVNGSPVQRNNEFKEWFEYSTSEVQGIRPLAKVNGRGQRIRGCKWQQ